MNNLGLNDHNHNPFGGHHVCMWEGPSYSQSALEVNHNALKSQYDSNVCEIQRLRTLLDINKISWMKPGSVSLPVASKQPILPRNLRQTTLSWSRNPTACQSTPRANKPLPILPTEILLRILKVAVSSSRPIIDPFWPALPENMTASEQTQSLPSLSFLSASKAFRDEGIRFFITENRFIFTQVEALQNFANFSPEARNIIEHVTLRIVAKYYDDTAYKKVLRGNSSYHSLQESPTVWVKARPTTYKDKGIQCYAWSQLVDFLKACVIPQAGSSRREHLFPGMKSMRIDLVNFSEHIPFLGSPLISVFRWHVGRLLDELIVTGMVDEEVSNGEERYLSSLVKHGGVLATGCPTFASARADRLRTLPGYGLQLQIIKSAYKDVTADILFTEASETATDSHPEGGSPPDTIFPPEVTTWKYISDNLSKPQRRWIEFHRKCGLPVDMCGELQTMLEEVFDGSEDEEDSVTSSSDSSSDTPLNFDAWESGLNGAES